MSHLSPEELVDIAEGTRVELAHVAACEPCRLQLAEIRSVMAAVAEVEVPEPSPLFWDHFSARVGDAVAAEAAAPRARSAFARATADRWFGSSRVALPVAAALAALALVVAASMARRVDVSPGQPGTAPPAVADVAAPSDPRSLLVDSASDPLFTFVADLTTDMDMDTAVAAGLVSDDSADHAVTHLSEGELRALASLLQTEMAHGQPS